MVAVNCIKSTIFSNTFSQITFIPIYKHTPSHKNPQQRNKDASLSLETFGIHSWKFLIPNIEHCSVDVGFLHLCDWHHVSKFLLSDLLCLQDKECLEWNYRGKLVRLHIPIMFVIGDIEGHDKLCSRKHGHITKMGGVTHSCDIRRNKCNDPNATCNMF